MSKGNNRRPYKVWKLRLQRLKFKRLGSILSLALTSWLTLGRWLNLHDLASSFSNGHNNRSIQDENPREAWDPADLSILLTSEWVFPIKSFLKKYQSPNYFPFLERSTLYQGCCSFSAHFRLSCKLKTCFIPSWPMALLRAPGIS